MRFAMKKHYIPISVTVISLLMLQLACSLGSPAPIPATPTSELPLPSDTPQPTPTLTLSPVLPTAELPVSRLFSVAMRMPGETANVRSAPGQNSPVIGTLKFGDSLISGTGGTAEADNLHWIEIAWAQNVNGWVSSLFLTEYVPSATFCKDSRVTTLLSQFKTALNNRDGDLFAGLVSPTRGLSVRLITNGNWANYTTEQVSWLFKTSYSFHWGIAPGSGLDENGSFPQKIEPLLTEVVNSDYQQACNQVLLGGASYPATWPEFYAAFNFFSLYRPGAVGDELNWRTWLAGFEYVDGEPYLMALVHYAWEP
jgi:hypothetical protein